MEPKAIGDLAQLPDDEFFTQISIGLDLVFENASAMEEDAARLISQKAWRGARVLRAVADEEASKYLILLDAVRCPRSTNDEKKIFARQLRYFNDHLAKGIYAEYCRWSLVDFREAKGYVESCRRDLYLDGPEYVLWTFRNQILQQREESLYVDYVRTDGGNHWTTPESELNILGDAAEPLHSGALQLISAFQTLRISTAQSLSVIAKIWRAVEITDDLHFSELQQITKRTLKELGNKGLLNQDDEAMSIVTDHWLYPLYPLELGLDKVDRNALREAQRAEADRFYEHF